MNKEVAKAIVSAAQEGFFDIELIKDYSGRGMYGKTTCGVVMSYDGWKSTVAEATSKLSGDARENFINELKNIRTDNMGKFQYIYY